MPPLKIACDILIDPSQTTPGTFLATWTARAVSGDEPDVEHEVIRVVVEPRPHGDYRIVTQTGELLTVGLRSVAIRTAWAVFCAYLTMLQDRYPID